MRPEVSRVAASLRDEFAVLAVGNKADLLAVTLFGHAQSQFGGDRTDLRLVIRADRQQHAAQGSHGSDAKQHVGLVLVEIHAAAQCQCVPSAASTCRA